jgi:hypothetical protein
MQEWFDQSVHQWMTRRCEFEHVFGVGIGRSDMATGENVS